MSAALVVRPEEIPLELRKLNAWAVWRYAFDPEESAHLSKPPYNARVPEERAYATNPDTWSTFEQAMDCYVGRAPWFDGISFAIAEPFGIVGIDLDHVSEHGCEATRIIQTIGSYAETSPGNDGVRMFVRAELMPGRRVREWIEVYSDKRFLTVTGHRLPTMPREILPRQAGLDAVYAEFVEV